MASGSPDLPLTFRNEAWPKCPHCGKPRVTMCPICSDMAAELEIVSTHYADDASEPSEAKTGEMSSCSSQTCTGCDPSSRPAPEETAGDESTDADGQVCPPLVVCGQCDEPFEPQFARHCVWCNHDFGDGYVIQADAPKEVISGRAFGVAFGLVVLLSALAAYFAFVL